MERECERPGVVLGERAVLSVVTGGWRRVREMQAAGEGSTPPEAACNAVE